MSVLGAAVIVEPRNHPAFAFVTWSVLQQIPKHWKVHWFHGTKTDTNKVLEGKVLKVLRERIELHPLPNENLSLADYNRLLTSQAFWLSIPAEHILIFQTDSGFIFRSPHALEEFMEYDYVGAPWSQTSKRKWAGCVGNGGFSLRRRSAMLRVIQRVPYNPKYAEDVYFAYWGKEFMRVAPVAIAQRFSVECKSKTPYAYPTGFHKCWRDGVHLQHLESQLVYSLQ